MATAPHIHDEDYPWLGNPREFAAMAMPSGDARVGVEGQLVQLVERRGNGPAKIRMLSRGEATRLHRELESAARAFAVGEAFDAFRPDLLAQGEPVASIAGFPCAGHRTLEAIEQTKGSD